jgi:hypothetical protein
MWENHITLITFQWSQLSATKTNVWAHPKNHAAQKIRCSYSIFWIHMIPCQTQKSCSPRSRPDHIITPYPQSRLCEFQIHHWIAPLPCPTSIVVPNATVLYRKSEWWVKCSTTTCQVSFHHPPSCTLGSWTKVSKPDKASSSWAKAAHSNAHRLASAGLEHLGGPRA